MNKVPEREPWHMEGEDRINLCGSYSKSTSFAGRKVIVCKRCAQCKQDHPSGHQPDFDDPLVRKYLNY